MTQDRAREVLAGKLEAGGFLVSARKVRTPGELPAAWLWEPIVEAMLAIAEEARVAERERCALIAESLGGDDLIDFALNQRVCCSGVDCGCMGSTVGSYLEWHLATAIRKPLP